MLDEIRRRIETEESRPHHSTATVARLQLLQELQAYALGLSPRLVTVQAGDETAKADKIKPRRREHAPQPETD